MVHQIGYRSTFSFKIVNMTKEDKRVYVNQFWVKYLSTQALVYQI
jgi:hypothetical protein